MGLIAYSFNYYTVPDYNEKDVTLFSITENVLVITKLFQQDLFSYENEITIENYSLVLLNIVSFNYLATN